MAFPIGPLSIDPTLSSIHSVLRRVVGDLRNLRAPFALVGGIAISSRSTPRFTDDIDFALTMTSDAEAERLGFDLRTRGYHPSFVLENEATDRLATLRLTPPGFTDPRDAPVVDLLFATTGIESEIVSAATHAEASPGFMVPTARLEHLLAMKILSVRETRYQDEADIQALIKAAAPQQIASARALLDLIISRGYHRNRDLHRQLTDRLKIMGREG